MAELAMTAFVVLLILGAMNIPALGDAIGRRVRGPRGAPDRPLAPPGGARTR
jgi:sec-independent protein translocase protein TatA